jgi:membrane protease YdiL (CAAX protease family)
MTGVEMRPDDFHGLLTPGSMGESTVYALDRANPWTYDVLHARRRSRAWSTLLIAMGFSVAVLELFKAEAPWLAAAVGGVVAGLPGQWPDIVASGALQTIVFGVFLVAAMIAVGFEGRRLWLGGSHPWTDLAMGLACGSAGFCAAVLVAYLAGSVTTGAMLASPIGALALGAALVLFQSVAEEAFFRGWLQPVLCANWGGRIGLTVTAAAFAVLHIIAGAHGVLAVINLFLGGLLFGLLALRTGGLLAPAAAHFAWNWSESGVLGLIPDPSGSLVSLKLTGASLWSGGADTMNGSLGTTLVLIVLVAGFAVAKPSASAGAPAELAS